MSKYVQILYGPYEAAYTISHKPQKLKGLKDQLLTLGFRVDLIPVDYVNHCVIKLFGNEVFRCNIKNFKFNTPYTSDVVCKRAIKAVVEASDKLQYALDFYWLRSLLEDYMDTMPLDKIPVDMKDYWPRDLEKKSLKREDPCENCVICCDELLYKKFLELHLMEDTEATIC